MKGRRVLEMRKNVSLFCSGMMKGGISSQKYEWNRGTGQS